MKEEINLDHICKIEGHAHLKLKIENNSVNLCELKASEGARFFEGLVINQRLTDIQEIVSRICGICSAAHSVAAIMALEEAIETKTTEQQRVIRDLLMTGERIRSHAAHLYFLALPDYFGLDSALGFGKRDQDKIDDALSLVTLGNKIVEVFGGRELHPFLEITENLPDFDKTLLIELLTKSRDRIVKTIELFSGLDYPFLERESDYLSLTDHQGYPSIQGEIVSNSGKFIDNDYKRYLKENIKEYATSKFVLKDGLPYQLGAISRINNNHMHLDHEVAGLIKRFMLKNKVRFPLNNPFHNNFCQAIELLIMQKLAIRLIENLQSVRSKGLTAKPLIKQGHGVVAVEAPRGTLFHEYLIDNQGIIKTCNIITPTAQNLNMMERDITQLVNQELEKGNSNKQILVKKIEKLIRSYDPCFSCSTHFLKVDWSD